MRSRHDLRALVYGDVDLNIIDGSAVWAQSTVQALSSAGCHTTLVLKARVETSRLLEPLLTLENVTVRRPVEEGMVSTPSGRLTAQQAAQVLGDLDGDRPYDIVVLRGSRVAQSVVDDGRLTGRLWTYLTDIPQSVVELSPEALAGLRRITVGSRYLLCQTEELRSFLEGNVPEAGRRTLLWPPAVPSVQVVPRPVLQPDRPVRLVYTGKFAPHWRTLEMTQLPAMLRDRGLRSELHMVGDKIHNDPQEPKYHSSMKTALRSTRDVVYHGGQSRGRAMEISAGCDFGLGWRDPSLDSSLELSTKILEFGAAGTPVIINRTPMHEHFYGKDYPLFVATVTDVADVIAHATHEPSTYARAVAACAAVAQQFSAEAAAARARDHLTRAFPTKVETRAGSTRALRVGIAGHDLKFFEGILQGLQATPGLEVEVDAWPALSVQDELRSERLRDWADVVFVEWCGPAAVWYSRHKRPEQRLVVRLHRFELTGPWPAQLDIDAVDQVVCVSEHYADVVREATGWPASKVRVIPNWVDTTDLQRPKSQAARFTLGMIGVAPLLKRPDIALDVLENLRDRDPRYRLVIKSKLTWEYWWLWNKPEEREYLNDFFRRVQTSRSARGAVVFDPFGADVGSWLKDVGFILSTSDLESFHLAAAEGMASGSVPIIRDWPGAETIYESRWIHDSAERMADAVRLLTPRETWEQASRAARAEAEKFRHEHVYGQFLDVLTSCGDGTN